MNASSPVITIEVGGQDRQADVRASLRRLYSRRVFWRAAAGIMKAVACALVALCALAFVDYGWALPRVARIVLLLLVLLVTLFILARNGWIPGRRRTLTEVAREIE